MGEVEMNELDERGFVFLGSEGKAYRCCLWGGVPWLFVWHPDNHWVSYRPLTQTDVWSLPHNLSAERQQVYFDVEAKFAAERQPLAPFVQAIESNPSDNLTGFDLDDLSIWGTKTRIEDLTPDQIKVMWETVQRYRREIESEARRADAAEQDNERLKAALEPFAMVYRQYLESDVIASYFLVWLHNHLDAHATHQAFENADKALKANNL